MKKTNLKLYITTIATMSLFVGCGKPMSSTSSSKATEGQQCVDGSCSASSSLASIDLKGTASGGAYDQTQMIDLDLRTYEVVFTVPMPGSIYVGDASGVIPELPGTTFLITQDALGQSKLVVRMPLKFLKSTAQYLNPVNPGTLPNGDPLPQMPKGEMPKVSLYVPKYKAYLYLQAAAVGIFVETPNFDPTFKVGVPIKNSKKDAVLGYFFTIPAKQTFNGGFFMSLIVPPSIARAIDDWIGS